ncbi:Spermidine export protein MdtI [Pseudomonas aeruginosa]|nr:Spermidine export protein MdtI [Pseudomonas aeruginosa]
MQNTARSEDDLTTRLWPVTEWGRPRPPLFPEVTMSWIILFFAGLFEVGWAVGLKYTEGFSKPIPTVLTALAMLVSLGLLGLAMKHLPLGTAYAVWTGVGAVGTVIAGIVLFGESMALLRLASVALIVCGLVGLKLSH